MGSHTPWHGVCIWWSGEDELFVAEVPELPGCMVHGETQEEALEQAKEAMTLWIETAQDHGDPIPEPQGRRLFYA